MNNNHMPICRQFNIEFNGVCTVRKSQFKCGKRILRRMGRCAAMSKDDGLMKGGKHDFIVKRGASIAP
jgi:hypothetical protein